eukprot:233185-Alexandrium_andersonii.AAC.1
MPAKPRGAHKHVRWNCPRCGLDIAKGDACARGGGRPKQWQEPFVGDGGDDGEGKTVMDKNGAVARAAHGID